MCWRLGHCELAWVGEAEARVARCASGEHGSEDAGPLVKVVVDFGRGLVLAGAHDPVCVLGQAALTGDWRLATGAARYKVSKAGQSKPSLA
jgi:hypothetical protein